MRPREPLISAILCSAAFGCAADPGSNGTAGPVPDDVDIGEDGGPRDPGPAPDCRGGARTVLRGVVTLPNGELPVQGARVYVPAGSPDDVPHDGECGECIDVGSLVAYTTSAADGSFSLEGLPAGEVMLVVEKGRFRRASAIDVVECEDNLADSESTRLPSSAAEGQVPRLAVVTGYYDRMEDVLGKLGVDGSAVDLYAGERDPWYDERLAGDEPAASLLEDGDRLGQYDIVFIDCGALAWGEGGPGRLSVSTAVRANLGDFVDTGGRLYVTDLSYDLVEGAFPAFIDYFDGGAGLDDAPEDPGAADRGQERAALAAVLEDDGLRDWLAATGGLDGDGITLRGLMGGWAMVDAVDEERARTWLSGRAPEEGRPLTITFEAGCGRTLFTSYHTVEGDRSADALSAQEMILAYLVLEIGECISEPELF